jgi:transposase-like protein
MMTNHQNQNELIPPYCPNSVCKFHFGTETRFYVKNGWAVTEKPPHKNQRYRCKACGGQFSQNSFALDFRKKLTGLSEPILHSVMHGMSNNSISRLMRISEGTIRDRIKTMSRQSLLFEKENFPRKTDEDIAYDGFESFTHSQFSPCYINTAVGSRSHFIYHNTFSPLNRKGRMTPDQKIRNKDLIATHGSYPRDSVYNETVYIFGSLSTISPGKKLFTDEHRAYARAARSMDLKMEHDDLF